MATPYVKYRRVDGERLFIGLHILAGEFTPSPDAAIATSQ